MQADLKTTQDMLCLQHATDQCYFTVIFFLKLPQDNLQIDQDQKDTLYATLL